MCQKFAIFATGTNDSTIVLKRLLTYIVFAFSYLSMGASNYVPHHDVYGRVMESRGDLTLVPFRYQGQYEDAETGLYYNRFRYYSPQMGMYISSDPIGLAGNNPTQYGYVQDVNIWLDIWGLSTFTLPNTIVSPKGVSGTFSKNGYHYRIDTNNITPEEGGFHIHIYKQDKEIAKVIGNGAYVKTHKGKTLRKPTEIPKTIRKEIRKLVNISKKGIKQCR